jgi:hypothetical protein
MALVRRSGNWKYRRPRWQSLAHLDWFPGCRRLAKRPGSHLGYLNAELCGCWIRFHQDELGGFQSATLRPPRIRNIVLASLRFVWGHFPVTPSFDRNRHFTNGDNQPREGPSQIDVRCSRPSAKYSMLSLALVELTQALGSLHEKRNCVRRYPPDRKDERCRTPRHGGWDNDVHTIDTRVSNDQAGEPHHCRRSANTHLWGCES